MNIFFNSKIRLALLLLLVGFVHSCKKNENKLTSLTQYFNYDSSPEAAGVKLIPIKTSTGDFKVWTKRFGNNPKIKILLLHGGPGMTHEYMECFETFFQREGFEFYEYDQLGSYYSDQPKDNSLWTIDRFVDEVEQVRKAIGANAENFYIVGNSWGGMLGMEYALKYQKNLKGLVIANMVANVPEYNQYSENVLQKQMNPADLKKIKELEAKKDFANPQYMTLLTPYYQAHICRLKEWPDALNRSMKHANSEIYTLMQGPSEMGISQDALFAKWNITDRLKEIVVPTLMVGAKYDTMDPKAMELQSKLVKNGKFLYCPNGSHLAMWDDQKVFMDGVIDFIHEVNEDLFK